MLRGASILGTLNIYNNIVKCYDIPCVEVRFTSLSATANVILYNNTLLTDSYSDVIYSDYGIAAGGSLTLKNNIIGSITAQNMYYIRLAGTVDGTVVSDYNLYWNSNYAATTPTPFYIYGDNHSLADWKGHGFDVNTPNATAGTLDPLLRNYSFTRKLPIDYDLKGTSLAIGLGTDVSITTDYFGFKRKRNPPDIGAIEYNGFRFYR